MTSPGRLIVLEGIDGCGSTTQAELLVEALRARGGDVCRTCEPSSGPVGQLIREILQHRVPGAVPGTSRDFDWQTMGLLFAADRLDHVHCEIEPALRAGTTVVSDRYDLSSLAYQSATSDGEPAAAEWVRELNRYARRPDLTVVLDVPVSIAEARRKSRRADAELFEKRELQRRLAELYAHGEQLVPGDRLVHVDGTVSPNEVLESILAHVLQVLA
jgi:dTMP kinase